MVMDWRERERLEGSYWPWDKCIICMLSSCEECSIYTEEYGELEQEYHEWQEDQALGSVSLKPKPSPVVGKNRDMEARK